MPEMAKLQLSSGANLNALNNHSMTPLMLATYMDSIEVLDVFLNAWTELTQKDTKGMTALHISAEKEHPRAEETVRMLVGASAPMDIADAEG